LPCIICGPVRTRRAYLRLSRVICLFFPSLFQYVKVRRPRIGELGGEYRNRTDDLLHAMQAL
jgi:hypothetical protein